MLNATQARSNMVNSGDVKSFIEYAIKKIEDACSRNQSSIYLTGECWSDENADNETNLYKNVCDKLLNLGYKITYYSDGSYRGTYTKISW